MKNAMHIMSNECTNFIKVHATFFYNMPGENVCLKVEQTDRQTYRLNPT